MSEIEQLRSQNEKLQAIASKSEQETRRLQNLQVRSHPIV